MILIHHDNNLYIFWFKILKCETLFPRQEIQ